MALTKILQHLCLHCKLIGILQNTHILMESGAKAYNAGVYPSCHWSQKSSLFREYYYNRNVCRTAKSCELHTDRLLRTLQNKNLMQMLQNYQRAYQLIIKWGCVMEIVRGRYKNKFLFTFCAYGISTITQQSMVSYCGRNTSPFSTRCCRPIKIFREQHIRIISRNQI